MSSTGKTIQDESAARSEMIVETDQEDLIEPASIIDEKAQFEELIVWGHEMVPDDSIDSYTRSINEWIPFAQQVHSYSSTGDQTDSHIVKT